MGVQIDAASKQLAELILHTEECQTRRVPGLKIDKDIDVAVSAQVFAQARSEERQSANVMPLAEICDRDLRYAVAMME